jgi:hypothetical protein
MKLDRRFVILLIVLAAVLWFFALALGCGRARPMEVIRASQRSGGE